VKEAPTVSVVIPVYNGAEYLAEAIESVLAQTQPATEILVFDNASTDATRQVALELLPESAVTTYEVNAGAVTNFNRSARAATGEFVLWLAADDRLSPRHLEVCTGALLANPTSPGCLPGIRFIDPRGTELRVRKDSELASPDPAVRLRALLRRPRWTEFYCLYRREALLASPMVLPESGSDVLLTWWFLLRAPLTVVDEPLLDYRVYSNSKSIADLAAALDPDSPAVQWRKARLWRRLREMAADPTVDGDTERAARRALSSSLVRTSWLGHLTEDVMLRWPGATKPLHHVAARVRRRRQTGRWTSLRARNPSPAPLHEDEPGRGS
jgi:glycosyltransferase involved in cell wall biosynthesis